MRVQLTLSLGSVLVIVFQIIYASEDEWFEQPKIIVDDDILLIEAARDKNIDFRLLSDSTLLINDVDMLDELRQHMDAMLQEQQAEPLSVDMVSQQFKSLKQDLRRLTRQLSNIQNRTRGRFELGILRRDLTRLRRLNTSLTALEVNLALDECITNPCKNGGSCYDGYKSFHCECAAGWEGPTCEVDVNECLLLTGTGLGGCMNNGQCINTPGSYRCVCRNGFLGAHCRLKRAVCENSASGELCGHGTCVSAHNDQGYVCICEQGWTKENATAACIVDVDECDPLENPCHDECINLPGSFKCGACPAGYTGDGKYCRDIDECAVNNGGCSQQPFVRCINTEGSYLCGSCPVGWVGDGRNCERKDSNSCDSKEICHPLAKCEYMSETVVCTCPVGMYGHGYGENGCSHNVSLDVCTSHLCQNNGSCVMQGRGTSCICQAGFTGALCEKGNACHSNPCQNGGICKLFLQDQYKCSCSRGYTGINCENLRSYCGATIFREAGNLQFPPKAGEYEPEERCAFLINTGANKILNVTFSEFELEDSVDCNKDFLQIHDGRSIAAQMLGRFCGKALPRGNGNIVSTHQQLFFWFRSDNATQGRGFNISWISQPHICGEVLRLTSDATGVIRSPGYPGKTPPSRDCEWQLNAPFGYRIVLRFYNIILGGNGNCAKDTLTVSDSDRTLLNACSSTEPPPIHSSSNELVLRYHTDGLRSDSAFQLHYEVVADAPNCGGIYTEHSGFISGYMNSPVCLYLIEQPKGVRIRIDILKMALLQSESCRLQKLEIFDGRTTEDNLLERFCDKQTEFDPIESSGNAVLLRYEYFLPGLNIANGFELKYSRVCNVQIDALGAGVITTPNYPLPYIEHMTCTYKITGPLNNVIRLNITDLSISENVPKMLDDGADNATVRHDEGNFLEVYLAKDIKKRYYRSIFAQTLVTTKNQALIIFHATENKLRRRGMRLEYSFESITCGGIFTQLEGAILTSLRTDCEWIIEVPENRKISLTLKLSVFILAGTGSVSIYDNSTSADGILLDSNVNDIHKTYDTNILTIIYRPAYAISALIAINYESVNATESCGGVLNAKFGIIKSPNWPKRYNPGQDCIWIINAPMDHQIELSVKNFTVETTADSCSDDYLEIRNGDMPLSPLIGRYCGTRIPSRIPSFANHLYLQFHADSYIEETGFYITFQQTTTGCGGKLTSYTGSIHSPHSMHNNIGATGCDWQIFVAEGSTVALTVNTIDNDICNGQLTVYDGPTVNSRLLKFDCGASSQTLYSSSHRLLVRYEVDPIDPAGMRFELDYQTNCNVVIDNKLQGVIESPNFPENYPPNINCAWDIRGGRNNKIQLAFSHFAVESRELADCEYDYVEVQDMQNNELLSQRHLCTLSDPITSEGNRLLIRFVSDASEHERGFRAEYKRLGCGEHLRYKYWQLRSPNAPYSVDLDCDWYIEAPFGKQILLKIQELHIETEQRDCGNNLLLVSENKNDTEALLKSCQVEPQLLTVSSPANRLYIHFRSSNTHSRKFFKATYTFVDAKCGGIFQSSSGLITTPNFFESSYATNIECAWSIQVPDSYGINLRFEQFNLTESENCQGTYVELKKLVDDGKEIFLEKACGSLQPLVRTVHGNHLSVKFKANANGEGRFSMKYEKQCGGIVNAAEGYLKSRLDEDCTWLINANEGMKVSLDILNLECQCVNGMNCTNALKIFEDSTDVLLYDMCAEHVANIIAPTNNLRVVAKNIGLRAKYAFTQNSCGGEITSLRGTLTSPYYPNSYPANVECVWQLQAMPGNAIQLVFESLDIPKSDNCNLDFLEIRLSAMDRVLGLYCDSQTPTEPLISVGGFWLKFRSRLDSTGNGFKLRWTYVHDVELNATIGSIESPPVVLARLDDQAYSWRIEVPRQYVVVLTFSEYSSGLQLYDGYDETALAIAIKYSPWIFTSSSNVLYLKTINKDLSAFKILWRTELRDAVAQNDTRNKCQHTIILQQATRQVITSDHYPNGYAPNINCFWIFKPVDPTQHVILDIYDARLEAIEACWADYLRITTSGDLLNWNEKLKICNSSTNNMKPFKSISGTPYVKMEFFTDSSTNGTGFKVVARTVCGANMTNPVGVIYDHYIKRSSTVNMTCLWHITVHPGKKIDFNIAYNGVELNEHEDCLHYGLIYDGLDEHAPLLPPGKFCNRKGLQTRTFRSSSNQVLVKYVVPTIFHSPTLNLWHLTYREHNECEGEVQLTHFSRTVNISSPNYPNVPQPHTVCVWTVIAPPGETITAKFVDRFDMNLRYCSKEFVELFDGSTTLARGLLRTCVRPNSIIHSTGNVLLVRYQTDIAEPRSGFRMNVTLSTCGGEYTGSVDIISSANYPALGAYPKPAVCEYNVKVPPRSRIRINFTDLHLPYVKDQLNMSDHIEFIDLMNMKTEWIFYGNESSPRQFDMETHQVLIRFSTFQLTNKYRGFRLKYTRISSFCYKSVSGTSGLLTMNTRVENFMWQPYCNWRITVPKGQRVRLEFIDLPRVSAENNTLRFLPNVIQKLRAQFSFYNDEYAYSRITSFDLSDYNSSQVISSSENFMFVKIMLGVHLSGIPKITARYSSDADSPCPTDIGDTVSGTIDIGSLLGLNSFYCTIKFTTKLNETISFEIQEYSNVHLYHSALIFKDDSFSFINSPLKQNITNGLVSLSSQFGRIVLLQNESTKLLRLQTRFRRHNCGAGLLNWQDGVMLYYPEISDKSYGRLECVWNLKANYEDIGYTLFGNVSLSDSCDREYISIRSGVSDFSVEGLRICRDQPLSHPIYLNHTHTTIIYHTENYDASGSSYFRLTGEKFLGSTNIAVGTVRTKDIVVDAEHYKNNMEASWDFSANDGLYLSLVFNGRFFIEDAANCSNDQFEVQQYKRSLWQTAAIFCGRTVPTSFNITYNRMRVIFRTNEAVTGDGFRFYVVSSCNVAVNATNELQTLTGPKFDRPHFGTATCSYIFESSTDQMILVRVKLKDFRQSRSSHSQSCEKNKFKAYKTDADGDEWLQNTYCDSFEVHGRKRIRLAAENRRESNFEIEYQLSTCGGNYSAPFELQPLQGEDANSYADNMKCVWHITAPAEHSIILRFKYFHMEQSYDCLYDFVDVFKGKLQVTDQRIAHICGNLTDAPPQIIVDSNQAVIVATSDDSGSTKGFLASVSFSPNCNEAISLSEGNAKVSLQRQLNFNASEEVICYYRVVAPLGYRVNVQLKKLQLNNDVCALNTASCENCNYLEIFDSLRADKVSMGKYCRSVGNQSRLISSNQDLLVQLNAKVAGNYSFELSLSMERTTCNQIDYDLDADAVVNLKFPDGNQTSYPANTHCTWQIKANKNVEIDLRRVQLPEVSQVTGKCVDYLQFKMDYQDSKLFCGTFNNTQIMWEPRGFDGKLEVTFHSGAVVDQLGGFELSIKYRNSNIDCNITYTALSNTIGRYYDNPVHCSDEIRVPEGYFLNIYITQVFFDTGTTYFNITDLKTNRTLFNTTDDFAQHKIFTSTNAVRMDGNAVNGVKLSYVATNATLPRGCGGDIFGVDGEFVSPPYSDRNFSECRWNIGVPAGSRLYVIPLDFDMGSEVNCHLDKIEFYDVFPNGEQHLKHTLCGRNVPVAFLMNSSRVLVVAKKSPNFDGNGFKIYFVRRNAIDDSVKTFGTQIFV